MYGTCGRIDNKADFDLTLIKFNSPLKVELVFLYYILLCCYTVYALEQVPNPAPGGPVSAEFSSIPN